MQGFNGNILSFTSQGMSRAFYAPRPIWRGEKSECTEEEYNENISRLNQDNWINHDILFNMISSTRLALKAYDFTETSWDVKGKSTEEKNAILLRKPLAPHWLIIQERALSTISSGLSIFQASQELRIAYEEQKYAEEYTDMLLDSSDSMVMDKNKHVMELSHRVAELEAEIRGLKEEKEESFFALNTPPGYYASCQSISSTISSSIETVSSWKLHDSE